MFRLGEQLHPGLPASFSAGTAGTCNREGFNDKFRKQDDYNLPGQSRVASWIVDIVLCSNDLLAEGIVHTSWLRLPPRCWSRSPGSLWSPLGSALCWELAELLLLLRSRLEPLWLRCRSLPLRLRGRLEALGLRCSLLGCTRGRRVRLELTEGLPLLRAELLLLDGKVLLVNLEMARMCVLLVSGGPE